MASRGIQSRIQFKVSNARLDYSLPDGFKMLAAAGINQRTWSVEHARMMLNGRAKTQFTSCFDGSLRNCCSMRSTAAEARAVKK